MITFKGYRLGMPCRVDYDLHNRKLYVDNTRVMAPINKKDTEESKKFIRLILGTNCNLQCSYCSQQKTNINYTIQDCDSFIIPEDTAHIEFWGGEPLLYKKYIDRLIPRLKEQKIKCSLITNGHLLNNDVVDWLNKNHISITISHDGVFNTRENCTLDTHLLKNLNSYMISSVISPGDSVFSLYECFEKLGLLEKLRIHPRIYNTTNYIATAHNELITASELFTIAATDRVIGIKWDVFNTIEGIFYGTEACSLNRNHVYVMDIKNNLFACQNYVSKQDICQTKPYIPINDHCFNCVLHNICGGGCKIVNNYQFYATCRSYFTYWIAMFSAAIFKMTGIILDKCESMQQLYWNINKAEIRNVENFQMPYLIEQCFKD